MQNDLNMLRRPAESTASGPNRCSSLVMAPIAHLLKVQLGSTRVLRQSEYS